MSNKSIADDLPWRGQVMDPDTTFRFRAPVHELTTDITPADKVFVLCHFGVPRIEADGWTLHFRGLVREPIQLSLEEIKGFPKHNIQSFIQCAGHPLDPTINTHNVSNAVWAGASLAEVLDYVGVNKQAAFMWAYGSDSGAYTDHTFHKDWAAPQYVKDIPLSRALMQDALLAYELNGDPLSAEHGFPLRLFIPGFYGTNSVKWLFRLEVSDKRSPGIFTNELYNDYVKTPTGDMNPERVPAWAVPPSSIIVFPKDGMEMPSKKVHVWGWCWGDKEIRTVEISFDSGLTWKVTDVGPRLQHSWQKFEFHGASNTLGIAVIFARAFDVSGDVQPLVAARNSSHSVKVNLI